MLTRKSVQHGYGWPGHDDYSAPPFHVVMHPHQYPAHAPAHGRFGGLAGGAVQLNAGGPPNNTGGTGYGFLGLDPSDPSTWIRPFNPAPGMIAYLNGVVR